MTDFSFPRKLRIVKKYDFDEVFKSGVFAADELLVVHAIRRHLNDNGENETRLGLSVGKVVGNSPKRNRWKRLIREAFRLQQKQLPTGLDLVVRPKKGAVENLKRVQVSILRLAQRVDRKLRESSRES